MVHVGFSKGSNYYIFSTTNTYELHWNLYIIRISERIAIIKSKSLFGYKQSEMPYGLSINLYKVLFYFEFCIILISVHWTYSETRKLLKLFVYQFCGTVIKYSIRLINKISYTNGLNFVQISTAGINHWYDLFRLYL